MAGDIKAASGVHPNIINRQYEQLVREVRRVYPWSRIILVGHTMAGNKQRQSAIQRLNALMQHIDSNERLVTYTSNNNSRLQDSIHISHTSKTVLCCLVATVIRKPHLESLQKF